MSKKSPILRSIRDDYAVEEVDQAGELFGAREAAAGLGIEVAHAAASALLVEPSGELRGDRRRIVVEQAGAARADDLGGHAVGQTEAEDGTARGQVLEQLGGHVAL